MNSREQEGKTDSQAYRGLSVCHGRQEHRQPGEDDDRHQDNAGEVFLAGCHWFPLDSFRRIFFKQIQCTRKQERVSMNIFKNSVLFNTLGLFKTERGMAIPVRDEGILRTL